jgi:hypothetical protein
MDSPKARWDMLHQFCDFASCRICGSRCDSGASGVRNINSLHFMLRWNQYGFHKRCARARYAELVFLHPVEYAGHIVHSCASIVRNIDALYFVLGWDWYGFHKRCAVTRYIELVFLHPVGSAGHIVHSAEFGA